MFFYLISIYILRYVNVIEKRNCHSTISNSPNFPKSLESMKNVYKIMRNLCILFILHIGYLDTTDLTGVLACEFNCLNFNTFKYVIIDFINLFIQVLQVPMFMICVALLIHLNYRLKLSCWALCFLSVGVLYVPPAPKTTDMRHMMWFHKFSTGFTCANVHDMRSFTHVLEPQAQI